MFLNWSWDDGTVRAKRRKRWLEKWIVGLVCVGLCGIRPRRHSTGFQGGPLVALEADVLVGDAGVGQDQARHLGAPSQVEVVQPVDVALAGHRCSVVGRRWRIANKGPSLSNRRPNASSDKDVSAITSFESISSIKNVPLVSA